MTRDSHAFLSRRSLAGELGAFYFAIGFETFYEFIKLEWCNFQKVKLKDRDEVINQNENPVQKMR